LFRYLVIDLHKQTNMPTTHSWIIRPCRRPSAHFRLFCFPRAGAGAASFRDWAHDCPEQIEVVLIQPPGRETRLSEPPIGSMGELASSIARAIEPLLDRSYALYGHSLGAKVAFETAREIRRLGLREPVRFFAAASSAPGVKWVHPVLHHLDDRSLLAELHRRYGGVPKEVLEDRELCALLVPALRADLKVVETYRYTQEKPLSFPITCLAGISDYMTPEDEAAHWGRETSADFRLQKFPGGHFFPAETRTTLLELMAAEISLSCQALQESSPTF
jgi:surfactin synthase thioesterase subunit